MPEYDAVQTRTDYDYQGGYDKYISLPHGVRGRGITLYPGMTLIGSRQGRSIIEVSGGQTAIVAKAGCSIENLTIRVSADANGDSIAIDGGDCSFTVKNVEIELRRTANRAIGLLEKGNIVATIRLQNVRITGSDNETRGIMIGDSGGGSNKTVLLERAWIGVKHNSVSCEASSSYIDAKQSFFDGSSSSGQLALYCGGMFKGCHIASGITLTGLGGNTIGLWNTLIENRLINEQSDGKVYGYQSFARTIRTTVPTARIDWYVGDINVVDEATGPITWQPYRFTRRVVWPMKIQDAIDSCLADTPVPSAGYRYMVVVGSGGAYGSYTPANYVTVVME